MNKIVGIMTAWCAELFIEPAIKQALNLCDEVLVCVAPHHEEMKQHADSTLEKALKYKDQIKLIDIEPVHNQGRKTKARAMNKMIEASELFKPGNWLFLLDVDEFWFNKDVENLRKIVQTTKATGIKTNEKYFFINTKHYLTNTRRRLWRITDQKHRFVISNKYTGPRDPVEFHSELVMFHYSALLSHKAKHTFWKTDIGRPQRGIMRWLDEIYLNYELDKQEYWAKKNEELFGHRTAFWIGDLKAQPDGTLYQYEGKHPELIEEAGICKIEDFRELYK